MRNTGFILFFIAIVAAFTVVVAKAVKTSQHNRSDTVEPSDPVLPENEEKIGSVDNEASDEPIVDTRPVMKVALSIAPPRKIFKAGEFSGFDIGIMQELGDRLDVQLKFEKCSLKECLSWLESGKSDITTAIGKNSDREKYLSFLNPKISYNSFDSVYILKNSKIAINKYSDLNNLKIGRLKNGSYIKGSQSEKGIIFVDFNNQRDLFRALLGRKINAFTGSNFRTEYELHELDLGDKIRKANYQVRSSFLIHYFVLSKKSKYFLERDRIEQVIASMQLSGVIDKVIGDFYEIFRLPLVNDGQ